MAKVPSLPRSGGSVESATVRAPDVQSAIVANCSAPAAWEHTVRRRKTNFDVQVCAPHAARSSAVRARFPNPSKAARCLHNKSVLPAVGADKPTGHPSRGCVLATRALCERGSACAPPCGIASYTQLTRRSVPAFEPLWLELAGLRNRRASRSCPQKSCKPSFSRSANSQAKQS